MEGSINSTSFTYMVLVLGMWSRLCLGYRGGIVQLWCRVVNALFMMSYFVTFSICEWWVINYSLVRATTTRWYYNIYTYRHFQKLSYATGTIISSVANAAYVKDSLLTARALLHYVLMLLVIVIPAVRVGIVTSLWLIGGALPPQPNVGVGLEPPSPCPAASVNH